MSGGVWTILCSPGSSISWAREEATLKGHAPAWSWQAKYVLNCLLWFLKSISL